MAWGLAVAVALFACGPGEAPWVRLDTPRNALASAPEELDLTSSEVRARLYGELLRQSEAQARAELTDEPAWFAVAREHQLVARTLPFALFAGGPATVDVESSQDPWPDEPRASLGGLSERDLAIRAGATFVRVLRIPPAEPVIVERAPGAPFAAAWLEGRLRLNPALIYLAAGAEFSTQPWSSHEEVSATPPPPSGPPRSGCGAAPGALFGWAPLLALVLLRRR